MHLLVLVRRSGVKTFATDMCGTSALLLSLQGTSKNSERKTITAKHHAGIGLCLRSTAPLLSSSQLTKTSVYCVCTLCQLDCGHIRYCIWLKCALAAGDIGHPLDELRVRIDELRVFYLRVLAVF